MQLAVVNTLLNTLHLAHLHVRSAKPVHDEPRQRGRAHQRSEKHAECRQWRTLQRAGPSFSSAKAWCPTHIAAPQSDRSSMLSPPGKCRISFPPPPIPQTRSKWTLSSRLSSTPPFEQSPTRASNRTRFPELLLPRKSTPIPPETAAQCHCAAHRWRAGCQSPASSPAPSPARYS